jgi:hypothetical protein
MVTESKYSASTAAPLFNCSATGLISSEKGFEISIITHSFDA